MDCAAPRKDAKTGHGRVLALEGPLRAIIERRLAARRLDSPLIFHRRGSPIGDIPKHWKRACKAAEVVGKLLYDLRRNRDPEHGPRWRRSCRRDED
jgi:hypothetical protein